MTVPGRPPTTSRIDVAPWLARWNLTPDGAAFTTPFGSRLAPVVFEGRPAMLKIAGGPEERDGAAVLDWWNGRGAARVLAREADALLLERAAGVGTLADIVRAGADTDATEIICRTASALHAPRIPPPPDTVKPLDVWFQALEPAARTHGGLFNQSDAAARRLLSAPRDIVVLHGDLHHDNVLDFGPKGWLAIDPKGLVGERGYDFANLFCNPWPEAAQPGRLARRLTQVATTTSLDAARLRQWILAYVGLSAAWTLQGGGDPARALEIAAIVTAD